MANFDLLRPCVAIDEVLERFLAARTPPRTARRARAYVALMDDFKEYLARYRLRELPCDPASCADRETLGAELLGQLHREQGVAIDAFLEIADDFGDRYLCGFGVDRATLRIAEAMVRDLGRWLRTTRLLPTPIERKKRPEPHLSSVDPQRSRSRAASRSVRAAPKFGQVVRLRS